VPCCRFFFCGFSFADRTDTRGGCETASGREVDAGGEERVDEGFTRHESKRTRLKTIKKPTSSITNHTPARSGVDHGLVAVIAGRVDEADVSLLHEGGVLEESVDDGCEWDLTEVVCVEGVSSPASLAACFLALDLLVCMTHPTETVPSWRGMYHVQPVSSVKTEIRIYIINSGKGKTHQREPQKVASSVGEYPRGTHPRSSSIPRLRRF